MGNKDDVWVRQREDGDWEAKREGGERASGVHDTQAEAWEQAKDLARESNSEALLTNREGKIRERNTYGNDPHPPKG